MVLPALLCRFQGSQLGLGCCRSLVGTASLQLLLMHRNIQIFKESSPLGKGRHFLWVPAALEDACPAGLGLTWET